MVTKGRHNFPSPLDKVKFSSLSYHESNLSLIARETMRLLVNHQLIPIPTQPKSISLEQFVTKDLNVLPLLHCIVFFFRRQKTKTYNESRKVLPM